MNRIKLKKIDIYPIIDYSLLTTFIDIKQAFLPFKTTIDLDSYTFDLRKQTNINHLISLKAVFLEKRKYNIRMGISDFRFNLKNQYSVLKHIDTCYIKKNIGRTNLQIGKFNIKLDRISLSAEFDFIKFHIIEETFNKILVDTILKSKYIW